MMPERQWQAQLAPVAGFATFVNAVALSGGTPAKSLNEYASWVKAQGAGKGSLSKYWEPIPISKYLNPQSFYKPPQTVDVDATAAMAAAGIPRVAGNVTSADWGDQNAYPIDPSGTGGTFMHPAALVE